MKQKRELGRKLLSFLLTLAMVLGLMPGMRVTVNAENSYNFKELTLADLDGKSDFNEVFNVLGGLVSYSYPDYNSLPEPSSDSYVRLIIGISDDPDYAYINIYNNGTIVNAGTNVSLNNGSIKIRDSMNAGIKYYYIAPVSVNSVSLNKSSTTLTAGKTEMLTAAVLPDNATDKTVKWSVGGTNSGAVKLYTDADCITEVGADATETLTVYAKGISAGSATITATSIADSSKSASCAVIVDKATPTADDFNFTAPSNLSYDGTAKTATVVPKEGVTGMGNVTVKYYSDVACTDEVKNPKNVGTYYVGITVTEGDHYDAITSVLHDENWKFTIGKASATADSSDGSSDNTNTNTDTSEKIPYDDVAISTGSVNDITGTAEATAESNPFETKIENNSDLTTLLSLTDEEVAQGVNVWLDIQDMSATVPQADKDLVQNASTNLTVGMYLDINLFKKVGDNTATKITETNGTVKASILIPESLWKAGRTFEIIRVHDGVATAIAGTYDENTHVFTFETDKFSTYALVYKDSASLNDSGTTSDSDSSNNSNNTQSTTPETGDPNDIRVWYLLLLASLGGLGFLGLSKKKKVNE